LSLGRIAFEVQQPVAPSAPTRADIVCFVGYVEQRLESIPVAKRGTVEALPGSLRRWLDARGWLAGPYARVADATALLHVPVPVDDWATFDQLFAWERRPVVGEGVASTYLGAAVRSFFAQGGRRCYVVRAGDPIPLGSSRTARTPLVAPLLGIRGRPPAEPGDRAGWAGIRHLYGLPDVSFVCLPDLPDLLGGDPRPVSAPPPPPPPLPAFEPCATRELEEIVFTEIPTPGVTRMAASEYTEWARVVNSIARLLAYTLREVQLVATVPLPAQDEPLEHALPRLLAHEFLNWSLEGNKDHTGLGSSFVQLVYPWAVTPGAAALPEGVEPPDGILAGIIARGALLQGAHHSVASSALEDVSALSPLLTRADLAVDDDSPLAVKVLPDRISTLGRSPRGLEVLSDTTPALLEAYRPAAVHRLVSLIVRGVRQMGETLVWEPSGEELWADIRRRIEAVLETLWEMGALNGGSSAEAYEVRCDRSTTTDNDLENGRLIVTVAFTASAPIERITLTLAMDESGQVSVLGSVGAAA